MSDRPPESLARLCALQEVAARQRGALVAWDREGLRGENAALGELLDALRADPPGPGDTEAVRLAHALREQLRVNAALARNGAVILEHLASEICPAASDGSFVGCRLSVMG